jgi:protein arginine kinase
MQCILPGFQPLFALEKVQGLDNYIGSKIGYATTDNYGYLTTSLANIGTGLRVSVMLHLAGLSFMGEAVELLAAAAELKISVRGLFGEGSKAVGDLFQVSNETTIGFTEREITSRVRAAAEHLIRREREARQRAITERKTDLIRVVRRAGERLLESDSLSGPEAMTCLSILRLGTEAGLTPAISSRLFSELLASMQMEVTSFKGSAGKPWSMGNDIWRAGMVREKLAGCRPVVGRG